MKPSHVLWLPNGEPLVLTAEELDKARRRGNQFLNANGKQETQLVSAAVLAEITSLPQTWLEEAARQKKIPSILAGKYRRFRPSAVIDALEREVTRPGRSNAGHERQFATLTEEQKRALLEYLKLL